MDASTSTLLKRGGGAEFLNCRRLISFFHAVVVRVVDEFAQTPYQVKIYNFL